MWPPKSHTATEWWWFPAFPAATSDGLLCDLLQWLLSLLSDLSGHLSQPLNYRKGRSRLLADQQADKNPIVDILLPPALVPRDTRRIFPVFPTKDFPKTNWMKAEQDCVVLLVVLVQCYSGVLSQWMHRPSITMLVCLLSQCYSSVIPVDALSLYHNVSLFIITVLQ